MRKLMTNTAALSWMVVVAVGLFVLVLVPSIHLPSRLDDGQELLNDAAPAFTEERVDGDRAGIAMVSAIVDLADPIVTSEGGAAAEVPVLERQRGNFDTLATAPPPVDFFAPLLVLVGILVVAYGGAMLAVVRFRAPAFPYRPVTLRSA